MSAKNSINLVLGTQTIKLLIELIMKTELLNIKVKLSGIKVELNAVQMELRDY